VPCMPGVMRGLWTGVFSRYTQHRVVIKAAKDGITGHFNDA